jgi:hypothetical protein
LPSARKKVKGTGTVPRLGPVPQTADSSISTDPYEYCPTSVREREELRMIIVHMRSDARLAREERLRRAAADSKRLRLERLHKAQSVDDESLKTALLSALEAHSGLHPTADDLKSALHAYAWASEAIDVRVEHDRRARPTAPRPSPRVWLDQAMAGTIQESLERLNTLLSHA